MGGQAGVDEAGLTALVDRFYAKVRSDVQLAPVFEGAVGDWPAHLEKLSAFWSSVMLTSGRYKGKKQLGIYRFTAPGQLEIAWGEPGSDKRPRLFTGKLTVGAGNPLAVYRSSEFKQPAAVVKELKALEGKWKVTTYHRFGRADEDFAHHSR